MGFLGNNLGMLTVLKIKTKEYYTDAYLPVCWLTMIVNTMINSFMCLDLKKLRCGENLAQCQMRK